LVTDSSGRVWNFNLGAGAAPVQVAAGYPTRNTAINSVLTLQNSAVGVGINTV
jgi:hypothetical protein